MRNLGLHSENTFRHCIGHSMQTRRVQSSTPPEPRFSASPGLHPPAAPRPAPRGEGDKSVTKRRQPQRVTYSNRERHHRMPRQCWPSPPPQDDDDTQNRTWDTQRSYGRRGEDCVRAPRSTFSTNSTASTSPISDFYTDGG